MTKESFMSALIMLGYERNTPTNKYPTKLYKDGVDVHVYNRNVIVRLGENTTNHHLNQDLEEFENFLTTKTEKDYDWTGYSEAPKHKPTTFNSKAKTIKL